jgi:hypothetical protein
MKYSATSIRSVGFVFLFLFICSVAHAKEIQLLNPDFFGKLTSTMIKLLYDRQSDELEPYMVTADIKCGRYSAATAFYPNKVTFADARESLNKSYKEYENMSLFKESKQALWRVDDKKFAIQLIQEEDRIRILYIRFQPTKDVLRNILKSTGANAEPIDENECIE